MGGSSKYTMLRQGLQPSTLLWKASSPVRQCDCSWFAAESVPSANPCNLFAGCYWLQVDITGCSAVGMESLQELRRFSLRVLRLARIWSFEVRHE
jgi:hypothetical protein